MAGPDEAMLSAQERAALAQLEARAAADDPRLADHLKGGLRPRATGTRDVAWFAALVTRAWTRLRPALWGPVLLVVGLALAVLSLAVSLALGIVGIVIAAAGTGLVVEAVADRVRRYQATRPQTPRQRAGD